MTAPRLDGIRSSVLTRMERSERNMRLSILGALVVEAAMLAIVLTMVDFQQRLERLIFVLGIMSYTIIVLGLVALGAHVSRTAGRVLAALDGPHRPDGD